MLAVRTLDRLPIVRVSRAADVNSRKGYRAKVP